MAYCGIVTGIFDFDKIDDEEVLDTLEPTFSDSDTMIRIHRCTFIAIASGDRAMDECWTTVGISPYLLIPHAVILCNETLVEQAESQLHKTLQLNAKRPGQNQKRHVKTSIAELERTQKTVERNLNGLYLPNVFNYITERTLYERGLQCRGLLDKLVATRNRLAEINSLLETERENRRNRGQALITLWLAILSILQAKDVYLNLFGKSDSGWTGWITLGVIILLTVTMIRFWGTRGK
jgi:hypothetical protein